MPQAMSHSVITGVLRRSAATAAALLGLALGGCSVPLADLPVVGLPAGAPARPAEPVAYPAVHDMPAARTEPVLDPAEQVKIENDLKTARDRQEAAAGQSSKASDR
jgi:hypothetical protein